MWLSFLIVFLAAFVTDICWAFYVNRVKEGKALSSGIWAVFLFLTGSVATTAYVTNPWYLVPAAVGAFAGTVITVWYNSFERKVEETFFPSEYHTPLPTIIDQGIEP